MNGIPALATNRGGLPEIIGNAGKIYDLPAKYYEAPFNRIPDDSIVKRISKDIISIFDDDEVRTDFEQKALKRAPTLKKESSVDRLIDHLNAYWQ